MTANPFTVPVNTSDILDGIDVHVDQGDWRGAMRLAHRLSTLTVDPVERGLVLQQMQAFATMAQAQAIRDQQRTADASASALEQVATTHRHVLNVLHEMKQSQGR